MSSTVTIPGRYNGPPNSGNGGFSCGVLASLVEGPARVRLHVPPPLDTPLQITRDEHGGLEMRQGETLVGSGGPVDYALDIPPAPSLAEAEAAIAGYPCYDDHMFPTCFVCGPARSAGDGLRLFPGPVGDGPLMACVWRPSPDLLDDGGAVRTEVVWSALDCPGYFAAMQGVVRPAVLGQLEGEILRSVPGDQELVVYSWPLGVDGRKYYGATAIASADAQVLASSRSTWIELRAAQAGEAAG